MKKRSIWLTALLGLVHPLAAQAAVLTTDLPLAETPSSERHYGVWRSCGIVVESGACCAVEGGL